jgi:hypothetical protein
MVADWVRNLTEEVIGGAPFAVGDRVRHPDGRLVEIVSGAYWGTHGLSNHWTWREVRTDGSLGIVEHGYGWQPETAGEA